MTAPRRPVYCPTAMDIDCCPDHAWSTPCCDRSDLHQPIEPAQDGGCLFSEAAARVLAGAAQRRSANPHPDDPARLRARIEALRAA